jgi:hypothetical protein
MASATRGTLPVRDITVEDLKGEAHNGDPLGSWDKINRELCKLLSAIVRKLEMLTFPGDETKIDRKVYLDTKLSIQVIAPKMQERRLCQAMELIDSILQAGGVERAKL